MTMKERKKEKKKVMENNSIFYVCVCVCVYNFISYIDRLAHAMVFPYFCKRRNVVLYAYSENAQIDYDMRSERDRGYELPNM
jgi:hypothetical protein